jgi:hypothetical protein
LLIRVLSNSRNQPHLKSFNTSHVDDIKSSRFRSTGPITTNDRVTLQLQIRRQLDKLHSSCCIERANLKFIVLRHKCTHHFSHFFLSYKQFTRHEIFMVSCQFYVGLPKKRAKCFQTHPKHTHTYTP